MYPLKFRPILKSTIWGGDKIIPFKHLDCTQQNVGESWEISDVPGDESVVANGADAGKNLTQMVQEYKGALVGEENYTRFGGKFPLLIKFIDAQDDLSIQVHPDDELAMKRHNSMGKTEMWYVIDNAEGKAHLRSGLSRSITPEQYEQMIADNTICDALADYAVQPGDIHQRKEQIPQLLLAAHRIGGLHLRLQFTDLFLYLIPDILFLFPVEPRRRDFLTDPIRLHDRRQTTRHP